MITARNAQDGYLQLIDRLIAEGRETDSRLGKTIELPDAVLKLEDPRDCWANVEGRKLSFKIAAVEALQLVGGVSMPGVLERVAPQFKQYAEDDGSYWGAYGPRVMAQLDQAQRLLQEDHSTRQAVASIWHPDDAGARKRDMPCTLSFTFLVRDDLLELHTTMRSNDLWLGTPYDLFQFCQLQLTMANTLDLEVGPYFHHAVSLHLYERNIEAAEKLLRLEQMADLPYAFEGIKATHRWTSAVVRARQCLTGIVPANATLYEMMLLEAVR